MPPIPLLPPSDVIKMFQRLGWQIVRQKGSHIIMTKPCHLATLSIPNHPEVARGTLLGLSFPYYYNAALSLELSLKAILVSRKKTYPTTHRLKVLSDAAGVVVEKDQEKTLEILSESISWLGRYPIPNSEGRWNNFHDVLLPKHKVVEKKVSRVMKNEKTFPTLKNYLAIWKLFESEYSSIKPAGA